MIALTIYKTIFTVEFDIIRFEKLATYYGFALPALISLVPFVTDNYGKQSDAFCWIIMKGDTEASRYISILMMFCCFYFWLWSTIICVCYWIVKSLKEIYEIVDGSFDVPMMLSITKKLKLYPLNLICCWSLFSIFRVTEVFG